MVPANTWHSDAKRLAGIEVIDDAAPAAAGIRRQLDPLRAVEGVATVVATKGQRRLSVAARFDRVSGGKASARHIAGNIPLPKNDVPCAIKSSWIRPPAAAPLGVGLAKNHRVDHRGHPAGYAACRLQP
ncbi:hypothetical protein N0Q91_11625 [Sinorhizobium sp. K101]|uniref:hypothetical protein n=1 Tax=unclassified Sinorhizobium TaxID=2613772 RepID=UPI0023D8053C|nr:MULTISPECIES: hypothetical protein [unclassified Sinorhizobium]WEJ11162.1 hypothetical protein N0Q90_08695 [Sinorhizobium sp. M103]WEJ14238.1 hypothetical protein N0Q91_11625 [Sinorhizobium sp. K101]